jgi:hypothetical protein
VKQLAELFFFFLWYLQNFPFSCDTISTSFHLNFFKRNKWAFHFSKCFLPLCKQNICCIMCLLRHNSEKKFASAIT